MQSPSGKNVETILFISNLHVIIVHLTLIERGQWVTTKMSMPAPARLLL